MIDAVRSAWPGPLVLLRAQHGQVVAARFVYTAGWTAPLAALATRVDGLVLSSSPGLDPGMNAVQKASARHARARPNLPLGNGLKPDWISRDPAVVAAYRADPGSTTA